MSTYDFIIALFCRVDTVMAGIAKHPRAKLYPSEIVTLALLCALKGVGERPFYRWVQREDHAAGQLGGKALSSHRWIVGAKLWDDASAQVADNAFHDLIQDFRAEMVSLTDTGFHAKEGDPPNMKPCKRGTWNVRTVVETVRSLLTRVGQLKQVSHRAWTVRSARLAGTMAVFNVLASWNGLPVDADGTIRLSIAECAL